MLKYLSLVIISVMFISCGKDEAKETKINFIFSDSAVTSFSQTSGVAKVKNDNIMNLVIPAAFAVDGNVSCIKNEGVSFQAQALGNSVAIEATCKSRDLLELDIRRGLLESLDGHKLRRTVFGQDAQPCGGSSPCRIDFSGGFQWEQAYEIEANSGCFEQYTFYEDGRVVIAKSTLGGDISNCDDNYPETTDFRFYQGKMEFDAKRQFKNGSEDYEQWCLDDNEDGTCD